MRISNNLLNLISNSKKIENHTIVTTPLEHVYNAGSYLAKVAGKVSALIFSLVFCCAGKTWQSIGLNISNDSYKKLIQFKVNAGESSGKILERLKKEVSREAAMAVMIAEDLVWGAPEFGHVSWQNAIQCVIERHENAAINRLINAVHSGKYISPWTQGVSIKNALLNLREIPRAFGYVQTGMLKVPGLVDNQEFARRVEHMPYITRPKAYVERGIEAMGNLVKYQSFDALPKKAPYTLCKQVYRNELSSKELVEHMRARVFPRLSFYDSLREDTKPFYQRRNFASHTRGFLRGFLAPLALVYEVLHFMFKGKTEDR